MKTTKLGLVPVFLLAAVAAQAEGWHFSAGPAWRARVKTEVRGSVAVPTVADGTTRAYDAEDRRKNPDPMAGGYDPATAVEVEDPANPGQKLWAVGHSFTETATTAGDGVARLDAADADSGTTGLKTRFGYDVWDWGPVVVALDLRFAGYWNLRSSAFGFADGGSQKTRTGADWFIFGSGPYPDDPAGGHDFAHRRPTEQQTDIGAYGASTSLPGHHVGARLKADLYQIGLGPTVSWRACRWLDAYAVAAALCNIAALDFACDGASVSETQCRLGFGADVGLVANVTDWLGLYGEVGYEWVDGFDASAAGVRSTMDFSSLVVSAGVVLRF